MSAKLAFRYAIKTSASDGVKMSTQLGGERRGWGSKMTAALLGCEGNLGFRKGCCERFQVPGKEISAGCVFYGLLF